MWPKANIGVLTGSANGLDVLDVDPKHNGVESLNALPSLPPTMTAKTGSGGFHYYFAHTNGIKNNNNGKLGQGLDFKTTGGFVIAPPSQHLSGNRYEWLDAKTPPATAPDWMIEKLRTNTDGTTVHHTAFRDDDWKALVATGTLDNSRHNAILKVAGLLFGGGRVRSAHLANALVHGFNQVCCQPPRPREDVDKIVDYVVNKVLAKK